MSEQPVEVVFCELCGMSIADGELSSGAAVRIAGKAIGACCLRQLRPAGGQATGGAPAVVGVGNSAGASAAAGGDSRLLSVAVLLLAALAAATIYLGQKIDNSHHRWLEAHGHLVEAQQAQGGLLGNLELTLGEFARQSSVDAVLTRLQESAAGTQSKEDAEKQATALAQALAAIRQEVRTLGEGQIDYRPLFEDLRGRQQRLLEQVAALRDSAAATPVVVPPAQPEPPVGPVDAAPAGGLPPEQAEQVAKLRNTDSSVRFIALDTLLKTKNPALLPHLLPMAKDGDAFVRRLAIDGLRDWKKASVVDVLLGALGDDDENVRDTAWSSLKLLTGQKLPFDAAAGKDARAKAALRWQEWWDKNKATFGS